MFNMRDRKMKKKKKFLQQISIILILNYFL